MTEPRVAPYGSWRSPITSDLVSSGTIRLEQTIIDGEDIYWIEMRRRCAAALQRPDSGS